MVKINIEKQKKYEDYIKNSFSYNSDNGIIKNRWGREVGSVTRSGYKVLVIQDGKKKVNFCFHRVCWFLFFGNWPDKTIDHIDGNKTNNKIKNLRLATIQENKRNTKTQKNNSLKLKNIYEVSKKNGKYCYYIVRFRSDGIFKYFSRKDPKALEKAILFRDEIGKKIFGKFWWNS